MGSREDMKISSNKSKDEGWDTEQDCTTAPEMIAKLAAGAPASTMGNVDVTVFASYFISIYER